MEEFIGHTLVAFTDSGEWLVLRFDNGKSVHVPMSASGAFLIEEDRPQ